MTNREMNDIYIGSTILDKIKLNRADSKRAYDFLTKPQIHSQAFNERLKKNEEFFLETFVYIMMLNEFLYILDMQNIPKTHFLHLHLF